MAQQALTVPNSARAAPRGVVLALAPTGGSHDSVHERETLQRHARAIAALLDYEAGGWHDPAAAHAGHLYFVPSDTLRLEEAVALGIRGPGDLFGGVVPQPFVASKAISHPLVSPSAVRPQGWSLELEGAIGDTVLAGWSAFSREDARTAGLLLLERGAVRIKPCQASGGRGQVAVLDAAALHSALEALAEDDIAQHGLVLEEDLSQVRTYSVGSLQVLGLSASYYGTQQLTRNAHGAEVYGGSDLMVMRGGFDALAAAQVPAEVRRSIEQARRYDAAVQACYPGFFASRRNYDVAVGRAGSGDWRSGVLEQSWRVGGATGAELAALAKLHAEPSLPRARAVCVEIFGPSPEPPPGATVHFRGEDPQVGLLTKYTVIEPDAHAR